MEGPPNFGLNWELTPQMQQIVQHAVQEAMAGDPVVAGLLAEANNPVEQALILAAAEAVEGQRARDMRVVPGYDSDSTVDEDIPNPNPYPDERTVPEYTGPLTRPPPIVTYNPPPPEAPGIPSDNLGRLVPGLSDYQPRASDPNPGTSQQAARHLQEDVGFTTLPREVRRMARERDQASRGRRIRSTQGIGKRKYPRRRGG